MKKEIVFILFMLLWVSGISQYSQTMIDNLKANLTYAKQDTSRVLLMAELCRAYRYSKPDTALKYGNQAVILSQKLKYFKGESAALSSMGWAYRELGDLPKAIDKAFNALRIAKNHDCHLETALSYSLFGFIYFDLKNYTDAIEYAKQSLRIFQHLEDILQITREETNLGAYYMYNNQLDSGSYYLKKSYKTYFSLNLTANLPFVLRNLGVLENKLGNIFLSKQYFLQSVELAFINKDHRNSSYNCRLLAEWYKNNGQLDSCIFYASLGLTEAKLGPFPLRILQSSILLAESYKLKKDLNKAYEYQRLMIETNEKLFGLQNIQTMQAIITDELKHQQQIESQKLDYQNQLKQYSMLTGLSVFILIGLILYRNNREKNKANNILQKTLSNLKSTQNQLIQKEKLASLGELTAGIAHEIQNPLNFVNNFSELSVDLVKDLKDELKKTDKDETYIDELFDDLSQNQEKINHHGKRASSIVKGMLEHSRASTGVKELTDINKLADEYLRLSYHGLRAKDKDFNADFTMDFDENLPKIEVIPQDIGRVLLNLINNAFYAVNERKKQNNTEGGYLPIVSVSTQQIDNQIIIKVKDNGTGMPESVRAKVFQPFFTTKPTGQGTGLGLSLAYDIVTKGHGGSLEVESTEGKETTFVVKLSTQ